MTVTLTLRCLTCGGDFNEKGVHTGIIFVNGYPAPCPENGWEIMFGIRGERVWDQFCKERDKG